MPTPLSADEREDLKRILLEAQDQATAAEYSAATEIARRARDRDPENIYVLAFEKQVEQLLLLASGNALTEESRTDILESLGGIVERAVAVVAEDRPSGPASSASSPATQEDRAAAMEWLKSQYFQQAHQFVRKGEYDHALAEIRRVFILEPGNETARQFESHILEIKELHRLVPEEVNPPAPTLAPPPTPPPTSRKSSFEPTPQSRKRRGGGVIIAIIAVAIAFIGFALIYNWVRTTDVKREPPPVVVPQPEVYFGDPVGSPDSARRAGVEQVPPEAGPARERADTTEPASRSGTPEDAARRQP